MATLAEAVDAAETDWLVSASIPDSVDYLTVGSEVVQVTATFPAQYQARDGSTSEPRIRVVRAAGGTTAASHADGTALTPLIPPSSGPGGAAEAGTVVAVNVGTNTTYYGNLFVGDADPADTETTTAGDVWIDTTGGVPYQQKFRNGANDGWLFGILVAKDALGVELSSVDVGPGDGSGSAGLFAGNGITEVIANGDGSIRLTSLISGTYSINIEPDGAITLIGSMGTLTIGADGAVSLASGVAATLQLAANGNMSLASATAGLDLPAAGTASLSSAGDFTIFTGGGGIVKIGNDPVGTQAAAVADIATPASATAEDVANKINELLASLRDSAELAT